LNRFLLVAKTMHGLEELLAEELIRLGALDVKTLTRAVSFQGDKELMYRANLWCRTALKILKPIKTFIASDENQLYENIKAIDWSEFMSVDNTLAVQAAVRSEYFTHSQYAALKVKDAIVDQFREKHSKRPSVDIDDPTLRINIQISGNECNVSLDSSGDSLHKRGWRSGQTEAPLNEVLAAGMILLTGWRGETNFIDPMCGSGTLLIEAALIAQNVPPCFKRKEFAFMKWKDYDATLWDRIFDSVNDQMLDQEVEIIGRDISSYSIEVTNENIRSAMLKRSITAAIENFETFEPQNFISKETDGGKKSVVIINPPFGERLQIEEINSFYKMIGDRLKKNYAGFDVWIISNNSEALKFIGLHPSKKMTLFNGSLECRYQKFVIYPGSKKASKN